ncbi:MAG: family 10 glycosylhydrolase [Fimbriimonadaceae bacterium]|nr:family 10 glycosylhydrolase [Fimbriimonadaceae bacterium]
MELPRFRYRGVWCGASDAGMSEQSVEAYVDRVHAMGINVILVEVKGGHGLLSWPSEVRPEAVAPGYESFDLPKVFAAACRKRGIEFHAWFIDFYEGENSPAAVAHPEWLQRDRMGRTTAEEALRGRRFASVWMCPAQRPGYADQWLIPLMAEFARRYDVHSIHHDYIRYPGDLAPDQYCFCDRCLEDMPRALGYYSKRFPGEAFPHPLYDREYLEAHWEPTPRVLPENWATLRRHMKADFLLDGSFFAGGRYDLDYFFYLYRTDAIRRFAREAHAAIKAANPKVGVSAAVFKNPIHSGRFIGQDWRYFPPFVDTCIPMNYGAHIPGTFEQQLVLHQETIEDQKVWAADYPRYWPGISVGDVFAEDAGGQRDVGTEFWPQDKLRRAIEAVAETGVEGICFFSEGLVRRYGGAETIRKATTG